MVQISVKLRNIPDSKEPSLIRYRYRFGFIRMRKVLFELSRDIIKNFLMIR